MGGGGGGKSQTTAEGNYPEEFKPLAKAAVEQIKGYQGMLPLTAFAPFQPQGVAALSPMEQFGIGELATRMPYLPDATKSIYDLPRPINQASENVTRAGDETAGSRAGQEALRKFLGGAETNAPAVRRQAPLLTQFPMPETAFPGLSRATVEAARPEIARGEVPIIGGPGSSVVTTLGTPGQSVAPVQGPMPPGVHPDFQQFSTAVSPAMVFRSMIADPYEQSLFDNYIAQGFPPNQAFQAATARSQLAGGGPPPAVYAQTLEPMYAGYSVGGGDSGGGQGP